MKIVNVLPAREIAGAETVSLGLVGEAASGNLVRFWFGLDYDSGSNETRIAVTAEWYRPATPDDTAEFVALTNGITGSVPEYFAEGNHTETITRAREFLQGSIPEPQKGNA